MQALRGLVFYLVFFLSSIPLAVAALVTWPFTSEDWRYQYLGRPWGRIAFSSLSWACGMSYRVLGTENIPASDVPVVIFSKHESAWETMFLCLYFQPRVAFVYKDTLHWIPFFGWALKAMGMISVHRGGGASTYMHMLRKGKELLARHWWIALCPEGTRVAPGEPTRFKTGGARFAVATGAKVLPIALNSGLYWPRHRIGKIPGTVLVSIGPVIETQGRTFAEVNAEAEHWVGEESRRLETLAS